MVITFAWVVLIVAVSFGGILEEFVKAKNQRLPAGYVWVVPVECVGARGIEETVIDRTVAAL